MDSLRNVPGFSLICFIVTALLFNSLPSWSSAFVSETQAAIQPSYEDHCAAILPESTVKDTVVSDSLAPIYKGYSISGGHGILGDHASHHRESFSLRVRLMYGTDVPGLFKIRGKLQVSSTSVYYYVGNYTHSHGSTYYRANSYQMPIHRNYVIIGISGFWSELSGKLCVVGRSFYSKYSSVNANIVLKLRNITSSMNITSLGSGTLESLDSDDSIDYFRPISLLMLPLSNYNYSLVSEREVDHGRGEDDVAPGLSSPSKSFCFNFPSSRNAFYLEYSTECKSAEKCSPFGWSFLPYIMNLDMIDCTEVTKMLRVIVGFWNRSYSSYDQQPFNPNTTLIGEGRWDERKNQFSIVACRFLGLKRSVAGAHVGDCSVRLTLRFSSVMTINETSSVLGNIWSTKGVGNLGYFNRIVFRSSERVVDGFPVKYEYTRVDKVRKVCPMEKQVNHKGELYPNPNSYDMKFDMSVKSSKRVIAWGYSTPVSVGNQLYVSNSSFSSFGVNSSTLFNISYNIGITGIDWNATLRGWNNLVFNRSLDVSAEGIYDAETGRLCMVGCRKLGLNNIIPTNHYEDCEILIKFQFSPVNAMQNGCFIEGSIESLREKGDPLHFQSFQLSSAAFSVEIAGKTLVRIDAEIIMVLVATTMCCIFVGLQLYHIKRNPDVGPLISIFMLSILTLGHMIPLVLNFEAFFMKNSNQNIVWLGSGGWLEVQEIAVRLLLMVAFLLEFRLLQLAWSARKADGKQNSLWIAEKKAVSFTLPLYASGVLIALWTNWMKNGNDYQQHTYWEDLKSYAGLMLDGFLLPQIVLNLFLNLRENVLSGSFYFGTTLVQLLPHVYDLYRIHSYIPYKDVSNIFADQSAGFYSTSWDIVITLGGLLFAVFIFLQQRFGGLCLVPWRFKRSQLYEKVPVTNEA